MFEQQVRRMLADPRSEALGDAVRRAVAAAAGPRQGRARRAVVPVLRRVARRGDAARDRAASSTTSCARIGRSLELLTADYTFVNERLARHYGIAGVSGPDFRKVTYPDDTRRGLLGHGSILTLTSHGNRTSPVLRGKWVMEVLLGSPPPPPPPDVPDLEETDEAEGRASCCSVAEQLALHRASPSCSSCHNVIDPIGLALDNFDVTGAWRIKDRGVPVDTAGRALRRHAAQRARPICARRCVARSDVVVTHFTEMLMSYALGRRVEYYDMPAIRKIVRDAQGQRLPDVVVDPRCGEERGVSDAALAEATDDGGKCRAADAREPRCGSTQRGPDNVSDRKAHVAPHGARGLGATVALPLLDSMVPARAVLAKTAGRRAEAARGWCASSRCTARPAAASTALAQNLWSPGRDRPQLRPQQGQPRARSSRSATT